MATSGRITTGGGNYTVFYLQWQLVSQDVGGNYSTINWQAGINLSYSSVYWGNNAVRIDDGHMDGQGLGNGTWSKLSGSYKDIQLRSGTKTVGHNSNGTRNFGAYINGWLYGYGNHTASGSWDLPTIPRQAYMTAHHGSFNDEQNPWVEWSNPAGFPVNVWLEIEGARRFQVNNVGSRYTWNFTEAQRDTLRGFIPNKNSTGVRYVVETNVGGTWMHDWRDNTFSITNATPVFTDFDYKDSNATTVAITGNDQYLIQNKSTLQATIASADKAVAQKMATMSKYVFNVGGVSSESSYAETDVVKSLGTITQATDQTLSVTAQDSRTNTKAVTKTVTVIPYSEPVLQVSAIRENSFENATTVQVSATTSKIEVGGLTKNTVNAVSGVMYSYREVGGAWVPWTNLASTYTIATGNVTTSPFILNLDNTKQYEIGVSVTDRLSTSSRIVVVDEGVPTMFLDADNKSVGINKMPEEGRQLDVAGDIYSNGKKVATAVNYSTWEQDTGLKWIDGKTIYQRTIVYDRGTTTQTELIIDNLGNIITFSGKVRNAPTDTANFFPIPYVGSNLNLTTSWFRNGTDRIRVDVGSGYASTFRYCVIDLTYTKAT